MIVPSFALGAPADISSRPKTADSISSASASVTSQNFDGSPDRGALKFEASDSGRGTLEATSSSDDLTELLVPDPRAARAASEPAPSDFVTNALQADSPAAEERLRDAPVVDEQHQAPRAGRKEALENRSPEVIVIRDEEPDQASIPANGHAGGNGHAANDAARRSKKENSHGADPMRTSGLGERPLAELSESQTNNASDGSTASTLRLVDSGIKRISSKTLDAHGFRKLQTTVNNNMEALPREKLVQLVRAVIPQLGDDVSPTDDRILTQQLLLLKTLSKEKKVPIAQLLPDILRNVLSAMGRYDEQSHTQVTLENSFDEFAGLAELPLPQVMDSALALLREKTGALDAQSLRTLGHAIDGVAKLLQTQAQHGGLKAASLDAILDAALAGIGNLDASIRKKSYGLAAEVYKTTPDQDKFWADVEQLPPSDKAMLHYTVQN